MKHNFARMFAFSLAVFFVEHHSVLGAMSPGSVTWLQPRDRIAFPLQGEEGMNISVGLDLYPRCASFTGAIPNDAPGCLPSQNRELPGETMSTGPGYWDVLTGAFSLVQGVTRPPFLTRKIVHFKGALFIIGAWAHCPGSRPPQSTCESPGWSSDCTCFWPFTNGSQTRGAAFRSLDNGRTWKAVLADPRLERSEFELVKITYLDPAVPRNRGKCKDPYWNDDDPPSFSEEEEHSQLPQSEWHDTDDPNVFGYDAAICVFGGALLEPSALVGPCFGDDYSQCPHFNSSLCSMDGVHWYSVADSPTAIWRQGGAAVNGTVFIAGGVRQDDSVDMWSSNSTFSFPDGSSGDGAGVCGYDAWGGLIVAQPATDYVTAVPRTPPLCFNITAWNRIMHTPPWKNGGKRRHYPVVKFSPVEWTDDESACHAPLLIVGAGYTDEKAIFSGASDVWIAELQLDLSNPMEAILNVSRLSSWRSPALFNMPTAPGTGVHLLLDVPGNWSKGNTITEPASFASLLGIYYPFVFAAGQLNIVPNWKVFPIPLRNVNMALTQNDAGGPTVENVPFGKDDPAYGFPSLTLPLQYWPNNKDDEPVKVPVRAPIMSATTYVEQGRQNDGRPVFMLLQGPYLLAGYVLPCAVASCQAGVAVPGPCSRHPWDSKCTPCSSCNATHTLYACNYTLRGPADYLPIVNDAVCAPPPPQPAMALDSELQALAGTVVQYLAASAACACLVLTAARVTVLYRLPSPSTVALPERADTSVSVASEGNPGASTTRASLPGMVLSSQSSQQVTVTQHASVIDPAISSSRASTDGQQSASSGVRQGTQGGHGDEPRTNTDSSSSEGIPSARQDNSRNQTAALVASMLRQGTEETATSAVSGYDSPDMGSTASHATMTAAGLADMSPRLQGNEGTLVFGSSILALPHGQTDRGAVTEGTAPVRSTRTSAPSRKRPSLCGDCRCVELMVYRCLYGRANIGMPLSRSFAQQSFDALLSSVSQAIFIFLSVSWSVCAVDLSLSLPTTQPQHAPPAAASVLLLLQGLSLAMFGLSSLLASVQVLSLRGKVYKTGVRESIQQVTPSAGPAMVYLVLERLKKLLKACLVQSSSVVPEAAPPTADDDASSTAASAASISGPPSHKQPWARARYSAGTVALMLAAVCHPYACLAWNTGPEVLASLWSSGQGAEGVRTATVARKRVVRRYFLAMSRLAAVNATLQLCCWSVAFTTMLYSPSRWEPLAWVCVISSTALIGLHAAVVDGPHLWRLAKQMVLASRKRALTDDLEQALLQEEPDPAQATDT